MTTPSPNRMTAPSGITIVVRLGSLAALALLLGTTACSPTGQAAGQASSSAAVQTDQKWLKQKAQESGGDFQKLSTEDQQRLTKQYGNMAPSVLKGIAQPAQDNF